jgi:type I restriction enzyme S subunit
MIPKDWEESEFRNMLEIAKGMSYEGASLNDKGVGNILINLNCFQKMGSFDSSGIKYYTGKVDPKSLVREGDILIANTDVTRVGEVIGYPIIVPRFSNNEILVHSMDTAKISIKGNLLKLFLYYLLSTRLFHNCMTAFSAGTTVLHLDLKSVRKMKLFFPKLKEQQKIVSILSEVDELIQKVAQFKQQIQTLKRGLLQTLLIKGVGHTQFKAVYLGAKFIRFQIPDAWSVETLSSVAKVIDVRHNTPKYTEEGYRLILPNNVKIDGLDLTGTKFTNERDFLYMTGGGRKPEPGDIIYSRNATFGIASRVNTNENFSLGQDLVLIKPRKINSYLLYFILNSRTILLQLMRLSTGSTFQRINLDLIRNFLIIFPPNLAEQNEIAKIIQNADNLISNYRQSLERLNNIKRGLMQKMLTGKIRVKI